MKGIFWRIKIIYWKWNVRFYNFLHWFKLHLRPWQQQWHIWRFSLWVFFIFLLFPHLEILKVDVYKEPIPLTRQLKFVPEMSLQNVRSFRTHFENLIFCFSLITNPDKHICRSLQNVSLDSVSFCRLWNQHEVFLRNEGGGFNDAPIWLKLWNRHNDIIYGIMYT